MNVEKMRRNLYRNVPDSIAKSFNPDFSVEDDVYTWIKDYDRKMHIKHNKKMELLVFKTYSFNDGLVRIQLVCKPDHVR